MTVAQDEVIYFVLPDRFENGVPEERYRRHQGRPDEAWLRPDFERLLPGGDLAGLIKRLDYSVAGRYRDLVRAGFKNKPVQGGPGQESAGYHAYWVTDFTSVDPHFGTNAEFKAFVDAAHKRGMKVYMDIIANHTADVIQYKECRPLPAAIAAAQTILIPAAHRTARRSTTVLPETASKRRIISAN